MEGQILVIDPDPTELRKLREILSREGFSIITVTDKDSAISICKKMPIRYVIANMHEFGLLAIEE